MILIEKLKAVGREGMLSVNEMEVSVIIRDARLRPENVDFLVEPTAGTGKIWVDSERIRLEKK